MKSPTLPYYPPPMLSYLHPFKLKHWVPCWQNLSSISIGCQVNTEQIVPQDCPQRASPDTPRREDLHPHGHRSPVTPLHTLPKGTAWHLQAVPFCATTIEDDAFGRRRVSRRYAPQVHLTHYVAFRLSPNNDASRVVVTTMPPFADTVSASPSLGGVGEVNLPWRGWGGLYISYVKDHGLLTSAAYRIQHLESRCKDTTVSVFLLVK